MIKKILSKVLIPFVSIISYYILEIFGPLPLFENPNWNVAVSITLFSSSVSIIFYVFYLLFKYISLYLTLSVQPVPKRQTQSLTIEPDKPKRIKVCIEIGNQRFNHHNFLKKVEVSFPSWLTIMPKSTNEIVPANEELTHYFVNLSEMDLNDTQAEHEFDIMLNDEFKRSSRHGRIQIKPKGFRLFAFSKKVFLTVEYRSKKEELN